MNFKNFGLEKPFRVSKFFSATTILTVAATAIAIIFQTHDLFAAPAGIANRATPSPQSQTLSAKAQSTESYRGNNKLGAYFGILGDPAPTIIGVNAAYNLADYLRLHAGFGQIKVTTGVSINNQSMSTTETSMTTVGAGALAMVPGWNLTPVAGLSYSHVFISGEGDFDVAANNVYGTVGLDWQTQSGFNLGVGLNRALTAKAFGGGYFNVGYFFM